MEWDAARGPLFKAQAALQNAYARAGVLSDPGLRRRMVALDVVFVIALTHIPRHHAAVNFWPLNVAFDDLTSALTAFLRRQELPEPELPAPEHLTALAWPKDQDVGIDGVMRYLLERRSSRTSETRQRAAQREIARRRRGEQT
jgi:hypothetical protein